MLKSRFISVIQTKESRRRQMLSKEKVIEYLETLIAKMGYPGKVERLSFREENKIGIEIQSGHTGILIGRKGKNLDSIQLLLNVYAGRLGSDCRVIIDAENYRERREENLVTTGPKKRRSGKKNKRLKAS